MAAAFVQGKIAALNGMVAPSTALAFTSNVVAGNALLAMFAWAYPGCAPSLSDSQGNVWTGVGTHPQPAGGSTFYVFTARAGSSAACSVTLTAACSQASAFCIVEVSGLQVAPFDVQAVATTTATPSNAGTLVTTANGDYIGALYYEGPNRGFSARSGWTSRLTIANCAYFDAVQATAGSITPDVDSSASGGFPVFGYSAAFKAAAPTFNPAWAMHANQSAGPAVKQVVTS